MPAFAGEALVLSARAHGEHGAIARFLTFEAGLRTAYVAGGRARTKRPLLQPGNRVALALRSRAEGQLPGATVELVESRALLAFSPTTAAPAAWLTHLTAAGLAEGVACPALATALDALVAGLAAGLSGPAAGLSMARYELLLLAECGFALDLSACALGGPGDDLAFVSPRTGRAVSRARAAGQPWAHRLLPLPRPLLKGGAGTAQDSDAALALAAHFLRQQGLLDTAACELRDRAIRLAAGPTDPRDGA